MFHHFPERIKLGKEGHKSHMSERDAVLKTNEVKTAFLPISSSIFARQNPLETCMAFKLAKKGLIFRLAASKRGIH